MATLFSRNRFAPKTQGKTLEGDFKKAGAKWLRARFGKHAFCLPIAGGAYQKSGSPDQVWSIRGIAVFIEWKRPDGRGRRGPKQQEMIDTIRAAGGRAGFVESWKDLEELVAGIEPVQLGMKAF